MIHIQLISRSRENLEEMIREAIKRGSIRSFAIAAARGSQRIKRKKNPRQIHLQTTDGPTLTTIVAEAGDEWQLLETFVGRLAYHFADAVAAINIQLQPSES